MKSSARLTSAVFQLTPTRTRCDLIIISNDKKEKIASGLLNPFLTQLKTAQDQIAKGGYSIYLDPGSGSDISWFTKATLERFVRFVSTPEILEHVYTIETEILQIEEAIAMQRRNDIGPSIVENHQRKPLGGYEGDKSIPSASEEKAIVLYMPGAPVSGAKGSCLEEGNSKVQLLKVLETRRTVLQKEQGMAFARAVAAGFDINHIAPLMSFAECFGAMRLMEACSRFLDLWKSKSESGQWLDIDTSEALATQSDFSAMKASGIVLSTTPNNHDEPNNELVSENNGKSGSMDNADNPVPNGQQEYIQGQFPHLVFPPWSMNAPPGAHPVFPAYPVQGMQYYQTYTGNGPFYHPQHYPMEHSQSNFGPQSGQKRQSVDARDTNNGSEARETNRTKLDDEALDEEVSHSQKSQKKAAGSNRKQSGMVLIRNINYITSKEKKYDGDTNSDSQTDTGTENEYFEGDDHDVIHLNNKRSFNSRGNHLKSVDKLNFNNDEFSICGQNSDDRQWQVFQDCLLKGSDKDSYPDNEGMFAMEKDGKIKRHTSSVDPLALGAQDTGEIQRSRVRDIHNMGGNMGCRLKGSADELLFSSVGNDLRESNDQTDIQFSETNGRKILFETTHEDFMIGSQQSHSYLKNSSDPLSVNSIEDVTHKVDRDSSHGMADETLIVPFRSMSLDQVQGTDRTTFDIDSEIPPKLESGGNKNKINYEPTDLSLMPERTNDKRSTGCDLALDFEMQACGKGSEDKGKKDVTNVKSGGLRKSDKDRSKLTSDSLKKPRTGDPTRKSKTSKLSPLEDARARAERLRSYKADLQKLKKEKEEAEIKRLESLKLARQKQIAARASSTSVKPSSLSPQMKHPLGKLSPATIKGSKFSDSEPGSSSPLQRSKIRASLGSSEPHKVSKASKLSRGSQMVGHRLTRSASSLSETKQENNGITPDSKASISRIRRLSEPKTVANSPVTTMKARSAEAVLKQKLSDGPKRNKVSAIVKLDKGKALTLPELKIKTSKSRENSGESRSAVKDTKKVTGINPVFPKHAELNVDDCTISHQVDAGDDPIVEKNVVVLDCEKPSLPTVYSSEAKPKVWNQQHKDCDKGEQSIVIPESTTMHASPLPVDRVGRGPITHQVQKQCDYNEARTTFSEKDPPNIDNIATGGKTYHAPYARASSLEDPCTHQSEYGKAPVINPELLSRAEEAVRTHVPDVTALTLDKYQVTSEKAPVKESKGLRGLLKFGKKNHASSSVDKSVDSECTSGDGSENRDDVRKMTSMSEVHTIKSLISQDETSTDGNALQKTSRHFSLLSLLGRKR